MLMKTINQTGFGERYPGWALTLTTLTLLVTLGAAGTLLSLLSENRSHHALPQLQPVLLVFPSG
ncbi:hypothetical protein SAMN00790413_05263 [Deinococcus hopiensis KR-140]|uniref:Uncharacterized protein n=1 Tax=Deinococcus hopiensis KR-140 TaxID=695939 RepID=A0A1W1UUI8_9DEIO|nr:hypothetical protein SAMN00790413_05263 [Deinococcus hopiensis KR-140]